MDHLASELRQLRSILLQQNQRNVLDPYKDEFQPRILDLQLLSIQNHSNIGNGYVLNFKKHFMAHCTTNEKRFKIM